MGHRPAAADTQAQAPVQRLEHAPSVRAGVLRRLRLKNEVYQPGGKEYQGREDIRLRFRFPVRRVQQQPQEQKMRLPFHKGIGIGGGNFGGYPEDKRLCP